MATIFITGVAGFLGSHLADRFLANGHRVIGVDNLIGGYLDNVSPDVEFHQYDCSNYEAIAKIMKGVNVVYHCACTAYEGLSVFSPYLITHNTFGITMSVLSAALANRAQRFVFCSSMARYGTQAQLPFTEDMHPQPQDPYGISKYASELAIRELCETHEMEYVIAVPHNIIGPRQKYDDPYRNVASIMINLMLQGRQPIIYGDGEQRRCFSFIRDVVDPLEKCMSMDINRQTINVGPDEESVTINELARAIAKLLNFSLEPIYMPDRPREVKYATCSAEKARSLLGYTTTYSLEHGLSEMIDHIQRRGTKPFYYHLPLEIITDTIPRTWKDRLF